MNKIKTNRLYIQPRTLDEMKTMIDSEAIPELKEAYTEMYENMKQLGKDEKWGSNWKISLHTGEIIGGICFMGKPNENGEIEIGYGIDEEYQHNGYATETVAGMIDWAFQQTNVSSIAAETDEENEISKKVLQKNQFVYIGEGKEGPRFIRKTRVMEFRDAERKDVKLILQFIKELARYEKMEDEVVATESLLEEWLFDKQKAEVIFAMKDGEEVGFALFFHNFSTFLGKSGIYLEDLYVKPEYRGCGFGKKILKKLAQIAVERGCGRLEWWCLDWNQPSIDFYLSLGAEPMKDWTVYRIAGETLKALGKEK